MLHIIRECVPKAVCTHFVSLVMPSLGYLLYCVYRTSSNDYTSKSETGYVLNAELYEGKTSGEAQNPHNVDKKIVQPYRGQGSIIVMDNFYMSLPLLNSLYSDGFTTTRISYNSIFTIDGNIVTVMQGMLSQTLKND